MFKKLSIVIAIVLVLALIGFHNATKPLEVRDAIQEGIDSVRKTQEISPDEEALLRVQLAVTDYMARNGRPPASLAVLVPTYFDDLPRDPQTKKPYAYSSDGVQYSLGSVTPPTGTPGASDTAKLASAPSKGGDATQVTPTPVDLTEVEQFVYDPSAKRDPFRPFDLSPTSVGDPNKTPLERYALSQLRLTSIASDLHGDPMALVEDEAGKGYTVRKGTKIGDGNGVVIAIEGNLMKILETRVDFAGVEAQTVVEMKIQREVDAKAAGKRKKRNR